MPLQDSFIQLLNTRCDISLHFSQAAATQALTAHSASTSLSSTSPRYQNLLTSFTTTPQPFSCTTASFDACWTVKVTSSTQPHKASAPLMAPFTARLSRVPLDTTDTRTSHPAVTNSFVFSKFT